MNIDWSAPKFPDRTIYQLILENLSKHTQPLAGGFVVQKIQRFPEDPPLQADAQMQLIQLFSDEKDLGRADRDALIKRLKHIIESQNKSLSSIVIENPLLASEEEVFALLDYAVPPLPYIVPHDINLGGVNKNGRIFIMPDIINTCSGIENALPPDDAIICAIIDEGIPALHERFRNSDGKSTRILAAHYIDGSTAKKPDFVGTNLLKSDIDAELLKISEGRSDEATAYKRLGLLEMAAGKPRGLAQHSTHGSVIADLAAGYSSTETSPRDLSRQPILAVNLPSRELIGLAGANLEDAVILGIEWIIDKVKKMHKTLPKEQQQERAHWPVVICLAYGQPAGPKDGTRPLEVYIDKVVKESNQGDKDNILVFMPSGNSNLDRGHAELTTDGAVQNLPLRLPPQDQTPTIIELWSNEISDDVGDGPPSLQILAPGEKLLDFKVPTDEKADGIIDDGKAGLIFYRKVVGENGIRYRYVIALRPTESLVEGVKDLPPSGLWHIALKWKSGRNIYADVQVDLPVNATNATARKAYFDDPAHQRYDNYVRLIDVGDVRSDPNEGNIVTQFGSHNALATGDNVHVISGYSASDFRPAPYSSAYFAVPKTGKSPPKSANPKPLVAMPSEAGPATYGIIGAGVGSGASQRLNGTSVATALAARKAVEFLLVNPRKKFRPAIITEVNGNEADHFRHVSQGHQVVDRKIGEGRGQAPQTGRVSRFSPDPDVSERFVKSPDQIV